MINNGYKKANSAKESFNKKIKELNAGTNSDYEKFQELELGNGTKIKDASPFVGSSYYFAKDFLSENTLKVQDETNDEFTKAVIALINNKLFLNELPNVDGVKVCGKVKTEIKQNGVLASIDALMFLTQRSSVNGDKKQFTTDQLKPIIEDYIKEINDPFEQAVAEQDFSFGGMLKEEILNFYRTENPDHFGLKINLEEIETKANEALAKFEEEINKIAESYTNAATNAKTNTSDNNIKIINGWEASIKEANKNIQKILTDKIQENKERIKIKVAEKLDYLTKLLKVSAKFPDGAPFLEEPAPTFTELGYTGDFRDDQDQLQNLRFKLKPVEHNAIEAIKKISSSKSGNSSPVLEDNIKILLKDGYIFNKLAGLFVQQSLLSQLDKKGQSKEEIDKVKDEITNKIISEIARLKQDDAKQDGKIVDLNDLSEFLKKNTVPIYNLLAEDKTISNDNIKKRYKNEDEDEKNGTFYQLVPNQIDENKYSLLDFFKSSPGRPRQIDNIYLKNNEGGVSRIYKRAFLATYQQDLTKKVQESLEKGAPGVVNETECSFLPGQGKTKTAEDIEFHVEGKEEGESLLNGKAGKGTLIVGSTLLHDIDGIKADIISKIDEFRKKRVKELDTIIQADEDPHTKVHIRRFFYLELGKFLEENFKGNPAITLGKISAISISGTPEVRHIDYLAKKVEKKKGLLDNKLIEETEFKDWHEGKQTLTETKIGAKDRESVRRYEELTKIYDNIAELYTDTKNGFKSLKESNHVDKDKSFEDVFVNNLTQISPITISKKEASKGVTSKSRHIIYQTNLSATESLAFFHNPAKRVDWINKILPDILKEKENEKEFYIFPPRIPASAIPGLKELRDKNNKSEDEKKYLEYLESLSTLKIIKFEKNSKGSWKEVASDITNTTDKEIQAKNTLALYNELDVIGGDREQGSRGTTDFFSHTKADGSSPDQILQELARNRSFADKVRYLSELKDDVIDGCNFYHYSTQEQTQAIGKRIEEASNQIKAKLAFIKDPQNKSLPKSEQPNVNITNPIAEKEILAILDGLKLDIVLKQKFLRTLNKIAEGSSKLWKYDPKSAHKIDWFSVVLKSIEVAAVPENIKKKIPTKNLYVEEYLGQRYLEQRKIGQEKTQDSKRHSDNFKKLFSNDKIVTKPDNLKSKDEYDFSDKLQKVIIGKYNDNESLKLKEVFSLNHTNVKNIYKSKEDKLEILSNQLGITIDQNLEKLTIIDLIKLKYGDKHSKFAIKKAFQAANIEKPENLDILWLKDLDLSIQELKSKIGIVEGNLTKEKEINHKSKSLNYLEDANIGVGVDGNFQFDDVKYNEKNQPISIPISLDEYNNSKRSLENLANRKAKSLIKLQDKLEAIKEDFKEIAKNSLGLNIEGKDFLNIYNEIKSKDPATYNYLDSIPDNLKQGLNLVLDDYNSSFTGNEKTYDELKSALESDLGTLTKNFESLKNFEKKYVKNVLNQFYPSKYVDSQDVIGKQLEGHKISITNVNSQTLNDRFQDASITIDDKNKLLFGELVDGDGNFKNGQLKSSDKQQYSSYLANKIAFLAGKEEIKFPEAEEGIVSEEIKIEVEKGGKLTIKFGKTKVEIKTPNISKLDNREPQVPTPILAYSEGKLNTELAAKRGKKTDVGDDSKKIQLYYSKPGSDKDNCFINENDSKTTIPHLSIQFNENGKRRVVDAAISKIAYNDVFKYTAGVEEKVRDCINSGYGINKALISDDSFGGSVIDLINDLELKKFLKLPTPIPINVNGNNFANVLERKEAANGNHLVKLDFLVDKIKNKIEIPKDAPKFRYVQVNGTGTFGRRALKLKFTLDDNGKLKYEGVFEKDEKENPIQFAEIKLTNDLTPEEKKLIEKMKVVATRQVVDHTKTVKTVSLDQVIIVEKDHVAAKQVLIQPDITSNLVSTNIFDNANFDMKPNSLIKNPDAIRIMAGRLNKGK